MVKKTVRFGEQAAVPAIGLGTWYMGEHAAQRQQEVAALRAGIDHGLTVIDTAEMYADGGAEEVVGQAIRRWGVSNLDTEDMQALWRTADGEHCATNQVLYHLASRGIEYDLLPWCQQHSLPVMAYCPLAQAGRLRDGLFQHSDIINMANARGITVAQLLLAWVIRHPGVLAIPKAASIEHVVQNAAALDIVLSGEELAQLDRLYPPPQRKTRLDMV
ncbi:aldo/keto reductase [Klebsiella pneumoniae]|uniref:aldo/keto reductase n=1 Tax=Klebsiella pneumoniae TaxID=573 RepID=UPI001EE8128F|nr:aldo/keto reductase [Klebsiella pneumoniae]